MACIVHPSIFICVQTGGFSWWRVCFQGLPRLVSRRYTMIPGTAAAWAAAVLRDPEVLLAGQLDQQPAIHGPQNYQQQSSPAKNLIRRVEIPELCGIRFQA